MWTYWEIDQNIKTRLVGDGRFWRLRHSLWHYWMLCAKRLGCAFFLFFRNFKAVLIVFVFKASIQRFSFRFSDFLLPAGARPGPVGPGTKAPTDSEMFNQFRWSFLHMKENFKTNKKRQLRSKLKTQYFPSIFTFEVLSFYTWAGRAARAPVFGGEWLEMCSY